MLWQEWGETAFAAARERRAPVLLFIRAAWCRWSREMERVVFADPRVSRLVTDRFVAVRVDKDRRPDIDARYSKGGWPTLAWLDDTGDLIAADNFLEPPELVARLELVAESYARNLDAIRARLVARAEAAASETAATSPDTASLAGQTPASEPSTAVTPDAVLSATPASETTVPAASATGAAVPGASASGAATPAAPAIGASVPAAPAPEAAVPAAPSTRAASARAKGAPTPPALSLQIVEQVARMLVESGDPIYGGWGRGNKFPHPEAIDFLLVRWSQTGDPDVLALVRKTLRKMEEGEIHDKVEGGFYRYATRADWSAPNHEKMLDTNALRLGAYLEAYQALGDESFRATAQGVLAWMHGTLLDRSTKAFKGSQDASPEYAHLTSVAARRAMGPPACDPTIFANWNAMAVSSLLQSAVVLREPRHREQALATLDFLVDALYDQERGVYHYWDGNFHLPGLLTDQAYVLRALIDAVQLAGENRYLPIARHLADLTIESHRSESGGFYDTFHDPGARGGLRQRQISILENAVMAEVLLRLSHLVRDEDYADAARATLASFAGSYKRFGHFVAGYARAVDLLFHEPVHVTIVGPKGSEATRALREAALRPYVASRVVQVVDPVEDMELLERFGLPGPRTLFEPARAYVHRGKESYAETPDPTRLAALMTRTERGTA